MVLLVAVVRCCYFNVFMIVFVLVGALFDLEVLDRGFLAGLADLLLVDFVVLVLCFVTGSFADLTRVGCGGQLFLNCMIVLLMS